MQRHEGKTLESVAEAKVIDCKTCGYAHVLPFPSNEEYLHLYAEDYYEKVWPDYFARFEEDAKWWELAYSERLSFLETLLPPDRRNLLDIGSGPGLFLLTAKNRGWNTHGIEPSKTAWAYSTKIGLSVTNDFLKRGTLPSSTYNAIHMSEVLEHIPDPSEFLNVIHSLLVPNGYLCIVVPNDFNPIQMGLRDHLEFPPWWIAPKHHLNYFNRMSLKLLVESAGYEVVRSTTTFPIDLFLLMGEQYVGNPTKGREVHGKRKTMELNMAKAGLNDLRLKLYESFAALDVGREIVLFARRK